MSVQYSFVIFDADHFHSLCGQNYGPEEVYAALDEVTGEAISEIDGVYTGGAYYSEEQEYIGSIFDVIHSDLEYEEPGEAVSRAIELLAKISDGKGNLSDSEPLFGFLTAEEVVELHKLLVQLEVSAYLQEKMIPWARAILARAWDAEMGLLVLGH